MVVGSRGSKVPVSGRALMKRINLRRRRNGHGHLVVRRHRATKAYYTVDERRNVVADPNVDLEALGRALRVLKDYEALAPEDA